MRLVAGEDTPVTHHWSALSLADTHSVRGISQSPGKGCPPLGPMLLSTWLCLEATLFSRRPFPGLGSGQAEAWPHLCCPSPPPPGIRCNCAFLRACALGGPHGRGPGPRSLPVLTRRGHHHQRRHATLQGQHLLPGQGTLEGLLRGTQVGAPAAVGPGTCQVPSGKGPRAVPPFSTVP